MALQITSAPAALADVTDVVQLVSTAGSAAQVPTDDYPLIASMIARASAAALKVIGRPFLTQSTVVETLNGNGKNVIQLSEGPVISVTSVIVNSITYQPRTTTPGAGWVNDDRLLYLFGGPTIPTVTSALTYGGFFNQGVQNVVVSYTAGYSAPPADVNDVIVELVAAKYKNRGNLGVNSKDLAGEHVSFTPRDFTKAQVQTLQRYSYWLSVQS